MNVRKKSNTVMYNLGLSVSIPATLQVISLYLMASDNIIITSLYINTVTSSDNQQHKPAKGRCILITYYS